MRMIYCGLPGVGKDYLLRQAQPEIQEQDIHVVAFGEMLFQELAHLHPLTNRDQLSRMPHSHKEKAIDTCVNSLLVSEKNLLINTHLVRVHNRSLQTDACATERLNPTFITCVTAEPEVILERSVADTTRQRAVLGIDEINQAQTVQQAIIAKLAGKLSLDFQFIDNSHTAAEEPVEQLRQVITQQTRPQRTIQHVI